MQYMGMVLAVKDIKVSRRFYEELFGMKVILDYGINITFERGLSLQQDFDSIMKIPKESILYKSNNFELYFETMDLDIFVNNVSRFDNVEILQGISEQPWGQRGMKIYDSDGHLIEVGENMKVVVQRFLDQGMSKEETAIRMDVPAQSLDFILNT